MHCCRPDYGHDRLFNDATARRDLRQFRKDGPIPTTRALIDLLRRHELRDATLLDIGGGVGAIHHELLDAGVRSAEHVDASAAYLGAAREEAERRGHSDRVEFVYGDFVAQAETIGAADVVTLDRVICCYPDMEALVAASASRARRLYGAVFPRDRWFLHPGFRAVNWFNRLRRCPFRVFLHPPADIDAAVQRHGLTPRASVQTFIWRVAVYERPNSWTGAGEHVRA